MDVFNGPRDPHGFGQAVPPVTVLHAPGGTVVIGHVDYIHGDSGRPCPEYIATKHELELLARHWFGVRDGLTADFMLTGQSGTDDAREIIYAGDRLHQIAGQLGSERMNALFEECRTNILSRCSPEEQRILLRQSDEAGWGSW